MFGFTSKKVDDADHSSHYDTTSSNAIEDGGGNNETELLLVQQSVNNSNNEQMMDPTTTTTSSNSAAKKRPNQPKKNKSITETIGIFGPRTTTTPTSNSGSPSSSANSSGKQRKQQRLSKKSKQQPMTMETFIKYAALGLLVGQMVGLVLLMRYSRTVQRPPGTPLYLASTAVFTMEVMKLLLCLVVVLYQTYHETTKTNNSSTSLALLSFATELKHHTMDSPMEMLKLCIPSLLYTIQNNLLYLALTNLDAATYQVCYQLKILTTALFSALLLGRTFSKLKWISLVVLTIGVAIVEVSGSGDQHMKGTDEAEAADKKNRFIGIVAVVCAACTSGFSGVYFEKILKGSTTSLWIRNIQMGLPSVLIAYVTVYFKDSVDVTKYGFFGGYTSIVWIVIVVQAVGGLIVATVVKYADNVLKVFATSFSIIISCIISAFLFDFQPSFLFVVGTSLVVTATVMYSTPERIVKKERKSLLPLHTTTNNQTNNTTTITNHTSDSNNKDESK